jgi:hypothetical protein
MNRREIVKSAIAGAFVASLAPSLLFSSTIDESKISLYEFGYGNQWIRQDNGMNLSAFVYCPKLGEKFWYMTFEWSGDFEEACNEMRSAFIVDLKRVLRGINA